eukprot:764539-Hanusia_phi.AAC.10
MMTRIISVERVGIQDRLTSNKPRGGGGNKAGEGRGGGGYDGDMRWKGRSEQGESGNGGRGTCMVWRWELAGVGVG